MVTGSLPQLGLVSFEGGGAKGVQTSGGSVSPTGALCCHVAGHTHTTIGACTRSRQHPGTQPLDGLSELACLRGKEGAQGLGYDESMADLTVTQGRQLGFPPKYLPIRDRPRAWGTGASRWLAA